MKILIANKFYYNRGGDCVASLALEKLLKEKGHEVAFFSMQYPLNYHSRWEQYFPSTIDFQTKKLTGKIAAATRMFYSAEVKKKFVALLNDFKPDVVHLNNIHSQLSPLIGEIAHNNGIKVIWTLHDYKLLCPRYDCLRNGKTVCEDCFVDKTNVLKNKCMKNSLFASYIAYKEAMCWTRERLEACTDAFECEQMSERVV